MKNKVASRRISKVLRQIKRLKDKYDELAAVTGEHFNVFSILRIKRKEVITHTPMLAELLNPHGSHHQGATFLKLFLETCIKQQKPAIHNNPETFRVRTEERTTDQKGQFDILLEKELEKENEACIVIENKIDWVRRVGLVMVLFFLMNTAKILTAVEITNSTHWQECCQTMASNVQMGGLVGNTQQAELYFLQTTHAVI